MQIIRKAVVNMETKLTQEEFEIWLLSLLKKVAIDPNTCKIESCK
jgi:hypothetical protein